MPTSHAPQIDPIEEMLALFNRSIRDERVITETLKLAERECHLVSPTSACGQLGEGFVVSFCSVFVNIGRETYLATGSDDDQPRGNRRNPQPDDRLCLTKTALDRIAAAAAVSWDPIQSRRLDSGAHPHYCHFQATGSYRHFDGQTAIITDHKEIDLRDGSAYVLQLRAQAERRNGTADLRIMNERVHILSFAATKARLRALREMGIRHWYSRSELGLPFVVARVTFTGRTTDPALHREFALLQAKAAILGQRALYPSASAQPLETHEPPPIETTGKPVWCDYCGTDEDVDQTRSDAGPINCCQHVRCVEDSRRDALQENARVRNAAARPASPAPASRAEAPRPAPTPAAETPRQETPRGYSGFTIPQTTTPIEDAPDGDLVSWANRIDRNLSSNRTDEKYRAKDIRLLAGLRAEIARRNGNDAARRANGAGGDNDPYPH